MRKILFLIPLIIAACDSGSDSFTTQPDPVQHVPRISNLALTPGTAFYMDGDGNVEVTMTFDFSDVGIDIATMHVEMSDGTTFTQSFPQVVHATGTHAEQFDMSTAVLGPCTVEIWLVDKAGNGSNHLTAAIVVESPVPEITALDPAEVTSGSDGLDLAVTGTGFLNGATVTWNGTAFATTFNSETEVIASVSSHYLKQPHVVSVRVRNPEPTAGASNELSFTITGQPGPGPGPQPTEYPIHITETIDGAVPNGPSVNGGLEWEGRYVVFASKATNLVEGDTNDAYDLFIRETCVGAMDDCTPTTTRAVMGMGDAEPNGDIGWTATSPDNSLAVSFNARHVAFVSSASNLVPDDNNGVDDVFLLDTCIEARTACIPGVVRVSLRADGIESAMPASYPAVADDGRYVAFVSHDPGMVADDTNGETDVFLRDTCRGAPEECVASTIRVSVANSGGQADGASGEPAFTGRYVAFSSLAGNLVVDDTNGKQDVFLRDTCIGEPVCVTSTRLVSVGHQGEPANGASSDPQVSWGLADFYGHDQHGRFVAFVSTASNLVPNDTNGASDVFERDLCAGEPGCTLSTARISVTTDGGQIAGDSWSPDFLRWDGETIPFVTAADGVDPLDLNGIADVFVRHHCPHGAPVYCPPNTRRASVGTAGAQTDGLSYAPRLSHCPFGAHFVTYISEASNILPDAVPIPNDGAIYMDINN